MGVRLRSFDEAEKDREHGPYDFTRNGKCSGCGGCCTNMLPLTESEIRTIKRYIKKHNIRPHNYVMAPLATKTLDLTCPFLDNAKQTEKCNIYEVRPAVCRYFICSDPYAILRQEEMLQEKRENVNMLHTFFGKDRSKHAV